MRVDIDSEEDNNGIQDTCSSTLEGNEHNVIMTYSVHT